MRAFALALLLCGAFAACGGATTPAALPSPSSEAPSPSAARPPVPSGATRVDGVVTTVTADKITFADGTSIALTATTRVQRQKTLTAPELRTGMYVAITAKRQADNTLLASIVSVFSESVSRAVAAGQRPLPEGNLMTNATIDAIGGSTFTVTFPGGGAKIVIAPDAQLIQNIDATAADVKVGAKVSASVANGVALSLTFQ